MTKYNRRLLLLFLLPISVFFVLRKFYKLAGNIVVGNKCPLKKKMNGERGKYHTLSKKPLWKVSVLEVPGVKWYSYYLLLYILCQYLYLFPKCILWISIIFLMSKLFTKCTKKYLKKKSAVVQKLNVQQ